MPACSLSKTVLQAMPAFSRCLYASSDDAKNVALMTTNSPTHYDYVLITPSGYLSRDVGLHTYRRESLAIHCKMLQYFLHPFVNADMFAVLLQLAAIQYATRSSKVVVDFGTNRKRACDFLFVTNSNRF